MLWFMVLQIVSTLVELIQLRRTSVSDKELEILLLRRQLAIYERKQRQPMRLTRGEKLTLVVLAVRLKATTGRTIKQLGDVIRIVKPKTVFLVGIVNWCAGNGRTGSGTEADDHAPIGTANGWWCVWRVRTAGGMSALRVSCSNWAMTSVMKRSPISCVAMAFRLFPSARRHRVGGT